MYDEKDGYSSVETIKARLACYGRTERHRLYTAIREEISWDFSVDIEDLLKTICDVLEDTIARVESLERK